MIEQGHNLEGAVDFMNAIGTLETLCGQRPVALTGRACRCCGREKKYKNRCGSCYMREWRKRRKEGKPTKYLYVPTRVPIDPGVHPLVKKMFRIMEREKMTATLLAERAGVCVSGIHEWRKAYSRSAKKKHRAHTPRLVQLEACLQVLGYRLAIKEIGGEVVE